MANKSLKECTLSPPVGCTPVYAVERDNNYSLMLSRHMENFLVMSLYFDGNLNHVQQFDRVLSKKKLESLFQFFEDMIITEDYSNNSRDIWSRLLSYHYSLGV